MAEKVGLNLQEVVDYGASIVYIDLMKQGREWASVDAFVTGGGNQGWDDGRPINQDANGWVSSLEPSGDFGTVNSQTCASIIYDADIAANFSGIVYKVTWDGYGGTAFKRNVSIAGASVSSWTYDSGASSGSFLFTGLNGKVTLELYDKDGNWDDINYPRNIKIYPSSLESQLDDEYHPDFIEDLSGVDVIRVMPIVKQKETTITTWESRPVTTWYTRATSNGIPIEDCVGIANAASAHMMYSYPTSSTDVYVTSSTDYFFNNLDNKLFAEWGNEPWNVIFPQRDLCEASGFVLFNTGDTFEDALKYYGYRSAEIFDIMESVYGGTNNIVRCLNCQQGNTWTAEKMLETVYNGGIVLDKTDAVMIAPYFGGSFGETANATGTKASSVDEIYNTLSGEYTGANWSLLDASSNMLDYKTLADASGIRVFAYEGGHHLAGATAALQNDTALYNKFLSVVEDPRMKDLYVSHLNQWTNVVDDLYCIFINTGHHEDWPLWGMREYQNQPREDSPMLDGWLTWIESLSSPPPEDATLNNSMPVHPLAKLPQILKDRSYAKSIFFSGSGATYTAGASGVAIPSVLGHSIIVWGYQSVLVAAHGSDKYLVMSLDDENNERCFISHAGDSSNPPVIFNQPVKVSDGHELRWSILQESIAASDGVATIIWYDYLKD